MAESLIQRGLKDFRCVSQKRDPLYVPYQRVNEIINGKRGITPGTALQLAKFFNISINFWLNLQIRWDLYHAQQSEAETVEKIRVYQL
jgi:antitoxin HigA-1